MPFFFISFFLLLNDVKGSQPNVVPTFSTDTTNITISNPQTNTSIILYLTFNSNKIMIVKMIL